MMFNRFFISHKGLLCLVSMAGAPSARYADILPFKTVPKFIKMINQISIWSQNRWSSDHLSIYLPNMATPDVIYLTAAAFLKSVQFGFSNCSFIMTLERETIMNEISCWGSSAWVNFCEWMLLLTSELQSVFMPLAIVKRENNSQLLSEAAL